MKNHIINKLHQVAISVGRATLAIHCQFADGTTKSFFDYDTDGLNASDSINLMLDEGIQSYMYPHVTKTIKMATVEVFDKKANGLAFKERLA